MKKTITILLMSAILVFMLFSCSDSPAQNINTGTGATTETDTDTEKDDASTLDKVVINEREKNYYTEIDAGEYLVDLNTDSFKIITTYEEFVITTENGYNFNPNIFEEYYIVVIRRALSIDENVAGYSNARFDKYYLEIEFDYYSKEEERKTYRIDYILVPKSELTEIKTLYGSVNAEGTYIGSRDISYDSITVDKDFSENDGDFWIIETENVQKWCDEHELPPVKGLTTLEKYNPYTLILFSKGKLRSEEKSVYVTGYKIREIFPIDIVVDRQCYESEGEQESGVLSFVYIANNCYDDSSLTLNTTNSMSCEVAEGRKIENKKGKTTYENHIYYPSLNGGIYYGNDLYSVNGTSYAIIRSYDEYKLKVENSNVDETIFEDNYVLVIRFTNWYSRTEIGFRNLKISNQYSNAEITLETKSSFVGDDFLEEEKELQEGIVDYIEMYPREKLFYLVVPKYVFLKDNFSYGAMSVVVNTKSTYIHRLVRVQNANIPLDTSYYVTNEHEFKKLCETFGIQNLFYESNNDILAIYTTLNRNRFYGATGFEIFNNYAKISLMRNATVSNNSEGAPEQIPEGEPTLIIINVPKRQGYIDTLTLDINYIDMDIKRYISKNEESYPPYEYYVAYSEDVNKFPEFDFYVITEYDDFVTTFEYYVNKDFESVFDITTLSNRDVLMIKQTRCCGYDDGCISNLRISGGNVAYLDRKYENGLCDLWEETTLQFIIIPEKRGILDVEQVVFIEKYVNETVIEQPYTVKRYTDISGDHMSNIICDLSGSCLYINSYEQLKTVYEKYVGEEISYAFSPDFDFDNNIILAVRRYDDCAFIKGTYYNFRIIDGKAYINFMSYANENESGIFSDDALYNIFEFIVVPSEIINAEFTYLTIVDKDDNLDKLPSEVVTENLKVMYINELGYIEPMPMPDRIEDLPEKIEQ